MVGLRGTAKSIPQPGTSKTTTGTNKNSNGGNKKSTGSANGNSNDGNPGGDPDPVKNGSGGDTGSGDGGGGGAKNTRVTYTLDGLPGGHNKVTTYGDGGGKPIKVRSGPFEGWSFGGGTRSQVYGYSFHPSIPAPKTLDWGFISLAMFFAIEASEEGTDAYVRKIEFRLWAIAAILAPDRV